MSSMTDDDVADVPEVGQRAALQPCATPRTAPRARGACLAQNARVAILLTTRLTRGVWGRARPQVVADAKASGGASAVRVTSLKSFYHCVARCVARFIIFARWTLRLPFLRIRTRALRSHSRYESSECVCVV